MNEATGEKPVGDDVLADPADSEDAMARKAHKLLGPDECGAEDPHGHVRADAVQSQAPFLIIQLQGALEIRGTRVTEPWQTQTMLKQLESALGQ
ncbi:hypothetical protein, partial [Microvirga aerophila]|uniref:hypothetical protein n=1 Tax=Microvirga aerophila TaxID=670291 RepID=UPI001AEE7AF1